MNTNEVRWYLHSYHENIKKISRLKEDLIEYRKMDGVKASSITDMPQGSRDNHSKTDKLVDRIEYVEKLEEELTSLMRIRKAIDDVYLYLKEPDRTIIEMRYFITPVIADVRQRKYNWIEIADEVKYSEIWCKRIDGIVVSQIQVKIHNVA